MLTVIINRIYMVIMTYILLSNLSPMGALAQVWEAR